MRLSRLGEFGLIERIRRATPQGKGVRLGIGDDAAWVECADRSLLMTADLLLEGVHFSLRSTPLYALGYKTLAVNLSDIAAMGGRPTYLVLSLGIPVDFQLRDVEEFYRGVRDLASQSGVALVGGDTSAARRLFISATLLGHAPYGAVSRAGARRGDDLYVTGTLGDSALGLELLKGRKKKGREAAYLISRHRFPTARVRAGMALARAGLSKAMIDVSDGLLQDLGHLCKASRVGAVVWEEALPLSPAYRALAGRKGSAYALTGGEDYELLFALRPKDRARLQKIARRLGAPVTRIGKCVARDRGVTVINGQGKPIPFDAAGYDHFKEV